MKRYINKKTGEFYNNIFIIVEDKQIFNPTEEILLANGYEEYIEPEPSEEEKLQMAKAEKLAEIDAYDASRCVFSVSGMDMWLDAPTREQLKTSLDACQAAGMTIVDKWFEGVRFEYPIETWYQMFVLVEVYAAQVLNMTETHKANVNAMTKREDVINYDNESGYPPKIEL